MGFIVNGLTGGATVGDREGGQPGMLNQSTDFMSEKRSYFDRKALDKLEWLLYL
jgi:hypothetical protein